MNKKIFVISGITLMVLITSIPILAEPNNAELYSGFTTSEEDKVLYDHILLGFTGTNPIYNLAIEICYISIRGRIMRGFYVVTKEVYSFLNFDITE